MEGIREERLEGREVEGSREERLEGRRVKGSSGEWRGVERRN